MVQGVSPVFGSEWYVALAILCCWGVEYGFQLDDMVEVSELLLYLQLKFENTMDSFDLMALIVVFMWSTFILSSIPC
jgi:hypothetical protein